ncbi:MAG: hypothetical protein RLZZ11_2112, partial [Cyanobacteriota bacterium]
FADQLLDRVLAGLPEALPIWRLPVQSLGFSPEHLSFKGTLSLPAELLIQQIGVIGAQLADAGFQRLVLFNGHGGQIALLQVAARQLRASRPELAVRPCGLGSGPDGISDLIQEPERSQGLPGGAGASGGWTAAGAAAAGLEPGGSPAGGLAHRRPLHLRGGGRQPWGISGAGSCPGGAAGDRLAGAVPGAARQFLATWPLKSEPDPVDLRCSKAFRSPTGPARDGYSRLHCDVDQVAMATLEAPELDAATSNLPDFTTETYKDAYSRINAIVIEGEQEAHDNYIAIGTLLPDQAEELTKLARMELKHMKGFTDEGLHRLCQQPGRGCRYGLCEGVFRPAAQQLHHRP